MTCRARGTSYDRSFRVLFVEGSIAVRSDADLVRLFLAGHGEAAEAAFEALIARHGPMVLGVCRRILGDEHAAQDAFQTVFLILAPQGPVGPGRRLARAMAARRDPPRRQEGQGHGQARDSRTSRSHRPRRRSGGRGRAGRGPAPGRARGGAACPASSARRWPSFTLTGSRTTRRPRRSGCPWARSAAGFRGRGTSSAHGSSAGDSPRRRSPPGSGRARPPRACRQTCSKQRSRTHWTPRRRRFRGRCSPWSNTL